MILEDGFGIDQLRAIELRLQLASGAAKRRRVLRAAFLAANEQVAIAMRHLEYAAHVEYEGMGKIVPRGHIS